MKQNDINFKTKDLNNIPLAERMRPQTLSEFIGQEHVLGEKKPLRQAILNAHLHSMIFWGPPGTGKTTLAQLIANHANAHFIRLSAIFSGVKDIREAVQVALANQDNDGKPTILFIDEIHRFNKAQQDVFLPYVENGTFILIGATTENPSFALNNALLSRARVYVLKRLSDEDLLRLLEITLIESERGLKLKTVDFSPSLRLQLVHAADGDARQVLLLLQILADLAMNDHELVVTSQLLQEVLQVSLRRFDKQGDVFYDLISALHKSVRGSNPDAALYWFCRMLDAGCDPRYIARRALRMAVEDIGLADPRAFDLCHLAAETYERLGSPEGELALAEAIVYLAVAAKSNAVYKAYNAAMQAVKTHGTLEVPLYLRNAPTKLMRELDYGKEYRYAHDEAGAFAPGVNYFPENLTECQYYEPTERGLEQKISERLSYFRDLDKAALLKK